MRTQVVVAEGKHPDKIDTQKSAVENVSKLSIMSGKEAIEDLLAGARWSRLAYFHSPLSHVGEHLDG